MQHDTKKISLRSKRFCASSSRKVGTRAKKKGMTGEGRGGGGVGKKETLAANPTILKNISDLWSQITNALD